MDRVILVLSTLDTKGPETFFLRDRIRDLGASPVLLDFSMSAAASEADIPSSEVARAAGADITEIRASRERKKITRLMINGAIKLAGDLHRTGRLAGLVGLGGSTGSLMATDVMRGLPFGLPKLMVSSTAALPGLATRYIGTGDIALLHTVIEIAGLSRPLQNILERAAAAIVGMSKVAPLTVESARTPGKPLVAMSTFGPTERCSHHVQERLEEAGFQVIAFSAAGVCDRAMEEMIGAGFFDAVVEIAPGGAAEELIGGMRAAGKDRLTKAAALGIPQVIAPGGVNLTSPRKSHYTEDHKKRRKYELDELRTFLRVSDEEMNAAAEAFAQRLASGKGKAIFLFPKKGWSAVDPPTGHMYDEAQDRMFLDAFRTGVGARVKVREVDANLEDDRFIDVVVEACLEIFPKSA
jgi:uncharacterized protein (UPF0261 family)